MATPTASSPDLRRAEARILFFTCAAHALTHVYMVAFSSILDRMGKDFGASLEQLTACVSLSTVLFGLGALPAGILADRVGEKPLIVAFFFLTAIGGIVLSTARGIPTLALGFASLGLGASISHPVVNAMIARGIREPGRAMGLNGFWGNAGEALGPVLAAQLAVLFHWRWIYLGLALPMLLLGVVCASTRFATIQRSAPAGDAERAVDSAPDGGPATSGRRTLSTALFFLLGATTLGGVQFWVIKTMLPTQVARETAEGFLSASLRAGYLTGFVYALGGVGQYLGGYLAGGKELRGIYASMFLIAAPLVYAVGRLSGVSLIATASCMAVFLFAVQPLENVLLARFAPTGWRGFIYGLKFVLSFGVGGVGPYLGGWLEARGGMPAVFAAAAGFAALAAVFAGLSRLARPTRSGAP
jgi:predicted MFS family arabinose efflux permease